MLELEAEREQRQRDYDKKLLLAKSKIENVQVRIQMWKRPGETGLNESRAQIDCGKGVFKAMVSVCVRSRGRRSV